MNLFGIGLPEMAVIAAIGLLVFGPKRLPELGKTLGRTLRGFQSASQEFEQEFRSAIAPETDGSPATALASRSAVDPVPGSAAAHRDPSDEALAAEAPAAQVSSAAEPPAA
jgi:sec-independent protein translocase protein TatA